MYQRTVLQLRCGQPLEVPTQVATLFTVLADVVACASKDESCLSRITLDLAACVQLLREHAAGHVDVTKLA